MQKVAGIIQYDHKETRLHEAEKDAFRKTALEVRTHATNKSKHTT